MGGGALGQELPITLKKQQQGDWFKIIYYCFTSS
jgi:hypothetical protein